MMYRSITPPTERLEPIATVAQSIASAETLQEVFRAVFLLRAELAVEEFQRASELHCDLHVRAVLEDPLVRQEPFGIREAPALPPPS